MRRKTRLRCLVVGLNPGPFLMTRSKMRWPLASWPLGDRSKLPPPWPHRFGALRIKIGEGPLG